jgi:hypothetical protein
LLASPTPPPIKENNVTDPDEFNDDGSPKIFFADADGIHGAETPFEAHKAMFAKQQMAVAEVRSAVRTMMMNLNSDDTYALYRMVQSMAGEGSTEIAAYHAGVLATIMDLKHGTCNCCGKMRHGPEDWTPEQFGVPDGQAH